MCFCKDVASQYKKCAISHHSDVGIFIMQYIKLHKHIAARNITGQVIYHYQNELFEHRNIYHTKGGNDMSDFE